jgi:hypothetical protein
MDDTEKTVATWFGCVCLTLAIMVPSCAVFNVTARQETERKAIEAGLHQQIPSGSSSPIWVKPPTTQASK